MILVQTTFNENSMRLDLIPTNQRKAQCEAKNKVKDKFKKERTKRLPPFSSLWIKMRSYRRRLRVYQVDMRNLGRDVEAREIAITSYWEIDSKLAKSRIKISKLYPSKIQLWPE